MISPESMQFSYNNDEDSNARNEQIAIIERLRQISREIQDQKGTLDLVKLKKSRLLQSIIENQEDSQEDEQKEYTQPKEMTEITEQARPTYSN